MMQAFEEEMRSLRRAIRDLWVRIGRPRDARSLASEKLAHDLGLPNDRVSGILDRAAADLGNLPGADEQSIDARPIIERTVRDLSKLGFHCRPFEEAIMEHYLQALPDRDYQILSYFKQGRKHCEIAELMNTNVGSVRQSLVKTYANLRLRMIESGSGDDGGLPAAPPSRASLDTTIKQTSLRQS